MFVSRDHFQLDRASRQVVKALLRRESHEVSGICFALCRRDISTGKVAAAHIHNLTLLHQQFHRLPDLFPRRAAVDVVHLVEVDVICLQPAKTIFAGLRMWYA